MCKSHIHCVPSIDSVHAPTAIYNTDSFAIGSEGAAQVRVELVVAVCRNETNYSISCSKLKVWHGNDTNNCNVS